MPHQTVISLNAMCFGFHLREFCGGQYGFINLPFVCPIPLDVQGLETTRQFLEGFCVASATFPIDEVSRVSVKCLPYPKFVFLIPDVVPHFIKFQDDGGSGACFLAEVRIHSRTVVTWIPKSFEIAFIEIPWQYTRTVRVLCTCGFPRGVVRVH